MFWPLWSGLGMSYDWCDTIHGWFIWLYRYPRFLLRTDGQCSLSCAHEIIVLIFWPNLVCTFCLFWHRSKFLPGTMEHCPRRVLRQIFGVRLLQMLQQFSNEVAKCCQIWKCRRPKNLSSKISKALSPKNSIFCSALPFLVLLVWVMITNDPGWD